MLSTADCRPTVLALRTRSDQAMEAEAAADAAPWDDNEDDDLLGFSRDYFLSKELGRSSSSKSSRKLSDIPPVDEQELRSAVSHVVPKHEREIRALVDGYKDSYRKWLFELRCGFNLLMYGFGSKKSLLEDFAGMMLSDGAIIVDGYLQSVNIKQAVATIAELLWDQVKRKQKGLTRSSSKHKPFDPHSIEDVILFLDGTEHVKDNCFVYAIIHNIDGPGLRDSECQQLLARISSCSHVRVVASIDHINAPLLWDKKMVNTQFNWCWHHVPTFEPYKVEGMFLPLILEGGTTAQSARTALIVLQSLTPNAQSVFKILAEHQLAHPKDGGVPVNTLYSMCRERFLVSSLMTLNSHLTEFKDHDLIKARKHSEGQDCFYIPLGCDALEKLLQELC